MKIFRETRRSWPRLGLYERFEQVIAVILTVLVSLVIVVATWMLFVKILGLVATGAVDPARIEVFQAVFGMTMIVLIALEFNHTLISVLDRGRSIVQVRTVVLIALLAVLRKFIVIEVGEASAMHLFALAAAALALGGVLWLVREQDRREAHDESEPGEA